MVPCTGVSGRYSVTINDVVDMANGILRWICVVCGIDGKTNGVEIFEIAA